MEGETIYIRNPAVNVSYVRMRFNLTFLCVVFGVLPPLPVS